MNSRNKFHITNDIIATKQTRMTNYVIDYVVQMSIFVSVAVSLSILSKILKNPSLISWFEDMNKIQEYIYGAIVTMVYYAVFESLTARSVGKYVTNTIVVLQDGTRPPTETMLRRSIYRILPFNALFFLWQDRVWHDKYTDTFVVNKSALEAKMLSYNNFNEIGKSEI